MLGEYEPADHALFFMVQALSRIDHAVRPVAFFIYKVMAFLLSEDLHIAKFFRDIDKPRHRNVLW